MTRDNVADHQAEVSLSQIAELADVSPSAVSNWRRRFDDFPVPVRSTADGKDVFALAAMQQWLRDHDRAKPGRRNEHRFILAADLLRGSGSTERTTELLCSFAALVYVLSQRKRAAATESVGLIELAEAADPALVGLFTPLADVPDERLFHLLDVLNMLDADGLRDLFEWSLARRGRFVETRTHEGIADLLVEFLGPDPVRVFDPAVGEAGFLLAASRIAPRGSTFSGQEVNEATWRIARQRLLLNGVKASIALGDSLATDAFTDLRADVVFCDPPYGAVPRWGDDLWVDSRWTFGVPPSKSADFAWIQHVIHHLAPTGRGYILLPASTLFRRGREEEIRRELVRRGVVEAVVSLAAGTAQHTAIPLALWVVRRPPAEGESAHVLLVDAAVQGAPKGGGLDAEVSSEIGAVLRTWRTEGTVTEGSRGLARAVSSLELLSADTNLLPSRWVQAPGPIDENAREQGFAEAVARIRETLERLDQAPGRDLAEAPPPGPASWTTIRHLLVGGVADVLKGTRIRPEDCEATGTRALRTQDVRTGLDHAADPCFVDVATIRPRPRLTEPGDIIVSPGGGKTIAVVDTTGGHVLVYPLQALRLNGDVLDPHVLAAFLESPRNRRFVAGTTYGYARLDLAQLEVPLLSREAAERLGSALDALRTYEALADELAGGARAARETLLDLAGSDDKG